jgi:hypothetical protein
MRFTRVASSELRGRLLTVAELAERIGITPEVGGRPRIRPRSEPSCALSLSSTSFTTL